ncbi:hypothetical protein JVX90_01770 [Gordonia sp. PDNC005]|uniref:hypothetical protein n=1 Tax=unclassified Gordonia (in: high G+C Gram-positive bacteria) TaxID=2657482 RepID=UPI001964E2F9|nr:hypothetical protein [Gordonia sp. PDNC005]QRY63006.1 hypothetical protein JVX90_01770 [Gordonia sp. PDNC005]
MRLASNSTRALPAQARLERRLAGGTDRPALVVVLPLDQRTATTPISAALAVLLQSLSSLPVAAVDADGTAQPLRRVLGSNGSGDLIGLAASHSATLGRRTVEDYVDMTARVPLASCWFEGPGAVPPSTLRDAVWKLERRFPSLVIDVPHGVPIPTIASASDLASHIVLVGDRSDIAHAWLHDGKSVAGRLADRGGVTVVAVGGDDRTRLECQYGDIVPMPTPLVATPEGSLLDDPAVVYGIGEVIARVIEAGGSVTD